MNRKRGPHAERKAYSSNPLEGYDEDEEEFIRAVDVHKREADRQFPTLCELLKVLKSLGYTKGGRCMTWVYSDECQCARCSVERQTRASLLMKQRKPKKERERLALKLAGQLEDDPPVEDNDE